eukprot:UN23259
MHSSIESVEADCELVDLTDSRAIIGKVLPLQTQKKNTNKKTRTNKKDKVKSKALRVVSVNAEVADIEVSGSSDSEGEMQCLQLPKHKRSVSWHNLPNNMNSKEKSGVPLVFAELAASMEQGEKEIRNGNPPERSDSQCITVKGIPDAANVKESLEEICQILSENKRILETYEIVGSRM